MCFLKLSLLLVVSTIVFMSDTVLCERRGSRAVIIPPSSPVTVTNNINDSCTYAVPSIDEGALFGNCRADDCILGYGGSTVWNVVPVTRQIAKTGSEQSIDNDSNALIVDGEENQSNNDNSFPSFGRLPSFVVSRGNKL